MARSKKEQKLIENKTLSTLISKKHYKDFIFKQLQKKITNCILKIKDLGSVPILHEKNVFHFIFHSSSTGNIIPFILKVILFVIPITSGLDRRSLLMQNCPGITTVLYSD